MGKFDGKVAIVTGAAAGIGKGIALELAKEGAKVVVSDINEENIGRTVEEIKSCGASALGVKADVSNSSEVRRMVESAIEKFGTVDILVNNAGIYPFKPVTDIADGDWDKLMNINLKGYFNCAKAVIPEMRKKSSGKIVNIASIAGAVIGHTNLVHYCASKGGVLGLTRALALELAQHKINVNAIAPGAIRTPGTAAVGEEALKQMEQVMPLKRIGEPSDIAKVAAFLASDDSSYITGQMIVVDGGWTVQ